MRRMTLLCLLALASVAPGRLPRALAATPIWHRVPPPAPAQGAAMAYDTDHHQVLMYTTGNSGMQSEMWSWDGAVWKLLPSGPTRLGMAVAYDSIRHQLVVFGGRDEYGAETGNTWGWDGTAWKPLATTGPSPRSGAAMAYDSARGKIVLFGGSSIYNRVTTYYGDTWEWDGTSWTQVATTGPSARTGPMAAFDSARGNTVLFGGTAGTGDYFADTWTWNGTAWSQAATTGPSGSIGAGMAFDTARGKVVLFAGSSRVFDPKRGNGQYVDVFQNDTWEWDGNAWASVAVSGPIARRGAAMAYDGNRGRMALFGGIGDSPTTGVTGPRLGDTWEYDGIGWSKILDCSPPPAQYPMLAYDSARGRSVLHAWSTAANDPASDAGGTYEWDGTVWRHSPTQHDAGDGEGAIAYDNTLARTLLIHPLDMWTWNGSDWTQTTSTGPSGSGWSVAYGSASNTLIAFGGLAGSAYVADTWKWDGTSWTKIATTGPSARAYAAMAYDSVRNKVVLFGGENSTTIPPLSDTWEWDGTTWKQKVVAGPTGRSHAAMAFDSARGKIVLSAGWTYVNGKASYVGDTWEWDGVSWVQTATTAPTGSAVAMAYDLARGKTVMYMGDFAQTWEYGVQVSAPYGLTDIRRALMQAGGLVKSAAADMPRLNVDLEGSSHVEVDMPDAALIARKVFGLSPNP